MQTVMMLNAQSDLNVRTGQLVPYIGYRLNKSASHMRIKLIALISKQSCYFGLQHRQYNYNKRLINHTIPCPLSVLAHK